MAARLLLLVAAAYATSEDPLYSLQWPGPEHGCAGAARPGGVFSVECTLAAGRVTLAADAAGSFLKLTCLDDNSTFSCDALQQAGELLRARLDARSLSNRTLERFEVSGCVLPRGPLACALRLVDAADARLVVLRDAAGALSPEHVAGLARVEKLRLYYRRGENETAVPWHVLAQLPALSSYSQWRGAPQLSAGGAGGPGGLGGPPALPGLRSLELADGGLSALPRGAFRHAPGVTTLALWGNQIESVDEGAFEGLSQLESLSLNSNRLASLPRDALAPCPRLARLDLYRNRLRALPPGLLRGLRHLRQVYIFDNAAPLGLPDQLFADLPALQHLELKSCSLQGVPEHLFRNSSDLRKLFLSGNNLTSVPESVFRGLVELEILDLSSNRLDSLHESLLANCSKLDSLDVRGNLLTDLPEGVFSGLKSLRVLNLGGNRLETLSKTVFIGLSALRELYLAGNRIQILHSETFRAVTGLEIVSLANNNMTISREVNTNRFISPELYAVYQLDQNSTSAVQYEYHSPLRELVHLRELDLSGNRVSLLCDDWRGAWGLRRLDLARNRLPALADTDLAFSSQSVKVDLRHNRITSFRPYAYPAGTTATPTVFLDDNPFDCDCRLFPAVDMLRRRALATAVALEHALCAAPPALRGTPLLRLRPRQLACAVAGCPAHCACAERPADGRVQLTCRRLPPLPARVPFTHLRLERPADLSRLPAHFKYVDLSSLNLTEAPRMSHPVEIDLSDNRLGEIPMGLLRLNCVVHLADNPIDCGCSRRAELEFLQLNRHLVPDYGNLTCDGGLSVSGIRADGLCAARDSAIVGCGVAAFGVLVALATALAYRHQTICRILLRKAGLWWGAEAAGRPYDAFVSFSHRDERYVVDTLVPRLEGGRRPLKLCLHYRDWVVGDFIPSQIARSVENSRRTIIVLSEHFLESVWAQMEFRAAHGRERLLVLMLEDLDTGERLDPDLRAYIAVNTYVKADDPLVFDRLKDAVLTRRRAFVEPATKAGKPAGLDVRLTARGELVNHALAAPA